MPSPPHPSPPSLPTPSLVSPQNLNEGIYYHCDQLLKSLYIAYVPEWIRAFGRDRILFLRAEDYWADPTATLSQTFKFLSLSPPTAERRAAMAALAITPLHGSNSTFWGDRSVVNRHVRRQPGPNTTPAHTHSRILEPMSAKARMLLTSFFAPYNAELARVLRDDSFRWSDVLQRFEAHDVARAARGVA